MSDEPTRGRTPDAEELLFDACLARPISERAAYLDQACAGDPALRRRVEELLRSHRLAESFLESPPAGGGAGATIKVEPPVGEKVGDRIGRYKLLQHIGEGGMGIVYMAEQEEPVRRRVALKIIKLGMDTRQIVARFEAERQALAMMDHPNIARVLDGGATEAGRPYFVMELVQGVPITEFCDKNRLPAAERLKLFVQVCQAIQSAHQKGVIHRDIKPSNVLVTLHYGEAMPKVIDFGIAKAINQRLTEKTLFTSHGAMIGTPAYMSPEQAEMSSLDVDTRTDVYSLGVLLYELLTGSTPFPAERLRSLAYGEMQRVIMEEEPTRPSARLTTLSHEEKTAIVRSHGQELAALSTLLKGDLDWIVMKCLEKDRRRRYETTSAVAADILRHLGSEPVAARPPSAAYRFHKLVRRNMLAFAAAGAVAASLIIGLTVSATLYFKERSAHQRAVVAEQEQARLRLLADARRDEEAKLRASAEAAEKNAQIETARSAQIEGFMSSLLSDTTQVFARQGNNAWLEEAMENAVTRARNELKSQPLVAASVLSRIADAYARLGEAEKPLALDKEAMDLLRTSPDHPITLLWSTLRNYADALLDQHRSVEAEALLRETIAAAPKLAPTQTNEIQALCGLRLTLSSVQNAQEKFADAEASLFAWRTLQRSIGKEGFSLFLIRVQEQLGQLDEAESSWREHVYFMQNKAKTGSEEWRLNEFGDFLLRRGKYAEAADFLANLRTNWLPGLGEKLGPGYMLGRSCAEVAWACHQAGDQVRAVKAAEEAEQMFNDLALADTLGFYTKSRWNTRPLLGEALIAKAAANVSQPLEDRVAELRKAEPLVTSELNGLEYLPGAPSDRVHHTLLLCQRLYTVWNELAPSLDRKALASQWERRAAEWIDPASPYNQAQTLRQDGKLAEAEVVLRQILAHERTTGTNATPRLARSLLDLADVLAAEKQFEESSRLLLEAWRVVGRGQPVILAFQDSVVRQANQLSGAIGNGAALTTEGFEAYHELLKLTAEPAQQAGCFNNLMIIDAAKQQWALENGKHPNDVPLARELWGLNKYMPLGEPKCPAGGAYIIGSLNEAAKCTVHGARP